MDRKSNIDITRAFGIVHEWLWLGETWFLQSGSYIYSRPEVKKNEKGLLMPRWLSEFPPCSSSTANLHSVEQNKRIIQSIVVYYSSTRYDTLFWNKITRPDRVPI